MKENDLFDLKAEIEEAKNQVAEKKGERIALMKQLKSNHECSTIELAKKKVKKLTNEITELDTEIEKGLNKLKEKFEVYE